MIGTKFGNYRVDQKLGEGGMGVVYLATDTELDRRVALKTLLSGSASGAQNEELISRFLREAKAASRLQHPSIVTMYHFGVEGDTRYMVMEYIDGMTLKKVISGRPLNMGQLLEIAIQVADGLAVAHEKGVIHRDLKSENVMVTPRGQVKILDFGLAKLRENAAAPANDEETAFRTEFGMVVGTVSTMSPEQAMGREVDARTDIFSFGVVLYQMATGKLPFEGPTPQATLALILNQEPTPVTQLNPDVPPELERLIQQCLQKSHVFRPTAAELVTRLKNIQASLSVNRMVSAEIRAISMPSTPATVPSATRVPAAASGSAAKSDPRMTASTPGSSSVIPKVEEDPAIASKRATYLAIKIARIAVSLATLTIPLSYLAYFVVGGGLVRAELIEGTALMRFMQAVVTPVLAFADRVFTFSSGMVVNGWNFMMLLLGIGAFVVRHLLLLPIEAGEHWAKSRLMKARASAPQTSAIAVTSERGSAPRLALLREYAETKKVLFQEKKTLAFLAIDVIGSTKMKIGEDQLVVEHAFAEYKKFVDRILGLNNCWKTAWTPDGVMCAFADPRQAVKAGQELITGLPWFNDGVHGLKQRFAVRCGVHCGDVVFPDNKEMQEISDFVIDVAGHLQKYGSEDTVWASREVLERLDDNTGFQPVERQVDNHSVFEWRPARTTAKAAAQ